MITGSNVWRKTSPNWRPSFSRQSAILEKKTKALRLRINVDLKELATEQSPKNRIRLHKLIAGKVQEIFNSQGSPKVDTTDNCLGQPGGGVSVSEGNAFANACVQTGEGGGVSGGGVEVGFHY